METRRFASIHEFIVSAYSFNISMFFAFYDKPKCSIYNLNYFCSALFYSLPVCPKYITAIGKIKMTANKKDLQRLKMLSVVSKK